MIARSEFSEVISDMVILLERQVPDLKRKDIVDFLEVLNSSDDKKLPVIILGKGGQLLFKDIETGETKVINKDSIREVLDYDEFQKSGNIALRKAS
ncbi:MAG: hypothetical protein IKQ43_03690 [Treponema sp.]|jgi:UDP-N-acetylenolpyruvoylglucosamine reductase|nr:hypothetical protein [Treponema sp.]